MPIQLPVVRKRAGAGLTGWFCAGIPEGGTTPSYGEIMVARELLNIKLNVTILSRGGDFLYSDIEFKTMLNDIEICKKAGVDGVVGCLTADGEIDMEKNSELIKPSEGMSTTFHRAFDRCKNPMESLESIISLGSDRISTPAENQKQSRELVC